MAIVECQTYSVKEAARLCGVSRSLLYALWKRGDGPDRLKFGRRTVITQRAIDNWWEAQRVGHVE